MMSLDEFLGSLTPEEAGAIIGLHTVWRKNVEGQSQIISLAVIALLLAEVMHMDAKENPGFTDYDFLDWIGNLALGFVPAFAEAEVRNAMEESQKEVKH